MKKNNRVTNFIAVLLFFAAMVYIGLYLRGSRDGVVTAEVVSMTVQESTPASGIVVRSESVIANPLTYYYLSAADGAHIAKNGVLGTAMDSEADQERAGRVMELELEISSTRAALEGLIDPDDLTGLDTAVMDAVFAISDSVARRDLVDAETPEARLETLLFDDAASAATEQSLLQLVAELDELQRTASGGTRAITAPASGTFSSILDGWEHLTFADTDALTPERVRALIADRRETGPDAVGKLITDIKWLFAAIISAEDAQTLETGGSVTLEFGRYYGYPLRATVLSISQPADGECAVLFSFSRGLADTLAMRQASADVILSEYTGLRVPARALHVDNDTGACYVYAVTAMQVERKTVDLLYEGDGYYIVSPGNRADSLRAGNEVVVSGRSIHEGMVLN